MSRDAILDKLRIILTRSPNSEAEILYVMVEIRKFLEREGEAEEKRFWTLKFFCDWVAHTELSFAGAKKRAALLDPEIPGSGPLDPKAVRPDSEFYRLMSLEPLREELEVFCKDQALPAQWVCDPATWRECTRLYGGIVLGCPLSISRGNHPSIYIKGVTLKDAKDISDHPDKRTFIWFWGFELSDGQAFTLPCEYRYPSPLHDASKPTEAEFGY